MTFIWVLMLVLTASVCFLGGWLLRQFLGQKKLAKAEQISQKLIEDAKTEAENFKREQLLEAKEEIFQMKQEGEREAKSKQADLQRQEKQLANRELNLDRKVDILNKKERELNELNRELRSKDGYLKKKELDLDKMIQEENLRLERISGLTTEEAKQIQMQNMIEKAKQETADEILEIREQAKQQAEKEAQEIVLQAIQRCSIEHVVDTTVSIIHLPDDEMKGRIIGREGRNIRTFESATGVEVLIDDTPQQVILSGYDPMRREIARIAIEKLIYDGRIHPGRIEEVVQKTKEEIDEKILEVGEQTLLDIGVHGVHSELIRLLGRQQFRTTFGQNLLQHSKEVAVLAGEIASQMGLEVTLTKRAGILHDIGKTAEEYGDAPFYEIGVELAKKFGENEVVQNAIACQAPNYSKEIVSPIAVLVQIANSISVNRPGAQKEMLENYIKRMRSLEEAALSFSGVVRSFAIQAGKELRVMVEHSLINDSEAQSLADKLSQKIKKQMNFPGQIKVIVIREVRSIDYAK